MNRFINLICYILFFLFIVVIVILLVSSIWATWNYGSPDITKTYGIPELIYYTAQILGVFATSSAVFVALFSREIRKLIFREKIAISLVNGGIREVLGDTVKNSKPEAQSYDCLLSVTNDCSKEIENVQIFLKEVTYRKDKGSKGKKITKFESNALYWQNQDILSIHLGVYDVKRIPLFKIYPKASSQTPDGRNTSELCIKIMGCKIEPKYKKNGIWKATYQIRTNEKILKDFELTIEWNGEWHSRYAEMIESLSVELKVK